MKSIWILATLGIVGLAAPSGAQKKGAGKPVSSGTPVTVTFRDDGGDKLTSVGGTDYKANVVLDGRLVVSTEKGSGNEGRDVRLSFSDCWPENCQTPPWTSIDAPFNLITVAVFDADGTQTSLLDMVTGPTYSGRMKIGFPDPGGKKGNGSTWQVRFDGEDFAPSTDIDVTRTSGNEWSIESTVDHRAELINSPDVDRGSYLLPFQLTVKR